MRTPMTMAGRLGIVATAAALLLATAACHKMPDGDGIGEFQKGIAYTGYSATAYEGSGPLLALDELALTNASWISLLVTGYQETIHATSIEYAGPGTPGDASLERAIAYAHGKGLKVMLKPHVDLSDDAAHYRGEIGPGFTAADWAAWFAAYRPFILHYAEMAERTGCELFCVGCELGTTAVHASEWREIVAAVKGVYFGTADLRRQPGRNEPRRRHLVGRGRLHRPGRLPDADPGRGADGRRSARRLDGLPGQAPAALREVGQAAHPDRDRLPQRRRRRPESLGLAKTGGRRLGRPGRVRRGGLPRRRGPELAPRHVLVAVVARSGRRRRRRHRLHAARQAGRGRPPLVVRPARMSRSGPDASVSTNPRG